MSGNTWIALALTALLAAVGCSSEGENACVEGRQTACDCLDGSAGVRACLSGGTWSQCTCQDRDADSHALDTAPPPPPLQQDTTGATSDGGSPPDIYSGPADVQTGPADARVSWPDSPQDYAPGAVSYVRGFGIVPHDSVPPCCRDFGEMSKDFIEDGTHLPDNALSKLAALLGSLPLHPPVHLQNTLMAAVGSGEFVLLLDHQAFAGTSDGTFLLTELLGGFASTTDFDRAELGEGEFLVAPQSFRDGTGEPRYSFMQAQLVASRLSAGPTRAWVGFPLLGSVYELTLGQTQLEAMATVDAQGVTYYSGMMSGIVLVDLLLETLNARAASPECSCLGLTQPLFVQNSDGSVDTHCVELALAEAACPLPEQQGCVELAAGRDGLMLCPLLPSVLLGVADLDVDGSCSRGPSHCDYEGLSVALRWTAVPGRIVGLE